MYRLSVLTLAVLTFVGCAADSRYQSEGEYITVEDAPDRNTQIAIREHKAALEHIHNNDNAAAMNALKRALTADITFAPAHNNLGKLYYHQNNYYLAAWEFQYAHKLAPQHPDPLTNLGLVYEAINRYDEAVTWHQKAYDLSPNDPFILGNYLRARLRRGDKDPELRDLLQNLILRDTRPEWNTWAREQLVLLTPTANKTAQPISP